MLPSSPSLSNTLLCSLSRTPAAALPWEPVKPQAGPVPSPDSRQFVYFPCSGLISLRCGPQCGAQAAIVGHRGSTGLGVTGVDSLVVCAGEGWRVPRAPLRAVARGSEAADELLAADSDALLRQMIEHLCAANRQSIAQRVAHWLLAAERHTGSSSFNITHETLAALLSVRRSGVTIALHRLEDEGAIRSSRNRVDICDGLKLRAQADAFRFPATSAARASSMTVADPSNVAVD